MVEKIGMTPCISSPFTNLCIAAKVLDDYMLSFDENGNLSDEDMKTLVGLIMKEAKGRLNPVLIKTYLDVLLPFYKSCIPTWYSLCSLHKDDIQDLVNEYNKYTTEEDKKYFLSMYPENVQKNIIEATK